MQINTPEELFELAKSKITAHVENGGMVLVGDWGGFTVEDGVLVLEDNCGCALSIVMAGEKTSYTAEDMIAGAIQAAELITPVLHLNQQNWQDFVLGFDTGVLSGKKENLWNKTGKELHIWVKKTYSDALDFSRYGAEINIL